MLSDQMIARLRPLRLTMRARATGGAGGSRKSAQTGTSAEFADYREYVPGDDIRRLDWHALARFDRPYLKLYMEEKESAVTLWLDASASMEAKWAEARLAAEAFAYLALQGGDRVRLVLLREGEPLLSPEFSSQAAYPRLADLLDRAAPGGNPSLMAGLRGVERLPRGISVLITDGYEETEQALDYLRYRRQECVLAQVLSAGEMEPVLDGAVKLTDSETGAEVRVTADRDTLARYQVALQCFLTDTRGACSRREAAYLLLDGRVPFEEGFYPELLRSGAVQGGC